MSQMSEKTGRPRLDYPLMVRISTDTLAILQRLAEEQVTSPTAVARRLIVDGLRQQDAA